ncbi:aspartate carbamoyltransferase [Achromobacter seleniivolatilans]|uniref:Aspartate carbamoyltransferase n=1 Tax=Achromobacter seleniivolatilans TaxID=3047478 RepID=A0ABY9LW11_9BURK|nr:aspartate carbamoyltransferase [Achromobacter sp. R39]WMD18717.1 aspartate carbamoyltransferase [Achromobacter sp. R39]
MLNPQLDRRGELIHLLTTEGLPRRHVERLLDTASAYAAADVMPPAAPSELPVFLFLPDDAPDRDAFADAAARLSLLPVPLNAQADTLHSGAALAQTVAGLAPGILILRHAASGAAHCAAAHAAPGLRVINAGDGQHADPLPALALIRAMQEIKQDLTNLTVTIVGDIRHSRVARSVIHVMTTLGVPELRVAAPRTLLPEGLPQLGVRACATLQEGLLDADVIIALPLHVEQISGAWLPSAREYAYTHGLTPASLAFAKPDALLLPAGALSPGVEIDGDVAASLSAIEGQLADFEGHLRVAAISILAGGAS